MNPSKPTTDAERVLSDTKPDGELVAKLQGLGRETIDLSFGGVTFGVRTLAPADEIYVYDRVGIEAGTSVARLVLARVYLAALMIERIDGQAVAEMFKLPGGFYRTDADRQLICNYLGAVFGQHWDRRAFRLFFRLLWAFSDTRHVTAVGELGVEAFLTPDELELYREYKVSEQMMAGIDGDHLRQIEDAVGDVDADEPPAAEVGEAE